MKRGNTERHTETRRESNPPTSTSPHEKKTAWETKSFEDCIESVKYTRKIQRKDFLDDGRFPIVSQEAEFTNGYWDDEADVFKVSTPVVIFGDHTQVLKYVDFDFVLGADGVKILQPRDFLHPKFFFYHLLAANFTSLGYARHYRLLKELEIKYPPLSEQQRIVGILDKTFDGLATAKANTEKNRQNARELFESYLQGVFTQRGPGWVEKPLGELCDILDNQRKPITKRDRIPGDIPYYGATGIQDYVKDFIFDEPLVLVGEDGAKWASGERTAFAVTGKCWVNNHAHVLRPHRDLLTDYWLISYLVHTDLSPFVSGLTVPKLNQANLREIPIPLPPLKVQTRLAKNAEVLESESERLVNLYAQKLVALEELKKSLLHQAFAGEL